MCIASGWTTWRSRRSRMISRVTKRVSKRTNILWMKKMKLNMKRVLRSEEQKMNLARVIKRLAKSTGKLRKIKRTKRTKRTKRNKRNKVED
jgi:glycerol-3-phosphate cytidylyltransferase-like family protein